MSEQSYPPPPPPGYGYGGPAHGQPQNQGSGLAITALVLGLIALFSSFTVVGGLLFGLVAIVLGFIASGRAKRGQAGGRGMAIAGIVTGLIGVAVAIGIIVLVGSLFGSETGQNLRECLTDAGSDQAQIDQCEREFAEDLSS